MKQSKLDISSPHDLPLQHVHNPKPVQKINYHALEHPQYTKIIAIYAINDIKRLQKQVVKSQAERYNDIYISQYGFVYLSNFINGC